VIEMPLSGTAVARCVPAGAAAVSTDDARTLLSPGELAVGHDSAGAHWQIRGDFRVGKPFEQPEILASILAVHGDGTFAAVMMGKTPAGIAVIRVVGLNQMCSSSASTGYDSTPYRMSGGHF
jgi:hypothetical protein